MSPLKKQTEGANGVSREQFRDANSVSREQFREKILIRDIRCFICFMLQAGVGGES